MVTTPRRLAGAAAVNLTGYRVVGVVAEHLNADLTVTACVDHDLRLAKHDKGLMGIVVFEVTDLQVTMHVHPHHVDPADGVFMRFGVESERGDDHRIGARNA